MKVIIAGSREGVTQADVEKAVLQSGWWSEIEEVVSGKSSGVDSFGEALAEVNAIPVTPFPVKKDEWKTLGKKAGPLRNRRMAEYADALIAVWDGKSRGTKNMIEEMERLGKPVFVYTVEE